MRREKEKVEGSSSSSLREQRNLREKERRMGMKHLFFLLSSHVSPTQKLPVPQLIDQATSYMIQKKEKVSSLNEKKRILLGGEVLNRYDQGSFPLPKLSVRSSDSTMEMNLVIDLNMKRVLLHELVSAFEEEGAQVMNASLQNYYDKTFYIVIAQAIVARIGIDPLRIEERLRNIIF